jgi:CSLREA domain-containing protein
MALGLLCWLPGTSSAATFVVDSLVDPGDGSCLDAAPCSLRDAIAAANGGAGLDTIGFSVAGTISPTASFPNITSPVTIDGETAPGWAPGAPVVEIEGSSAPWAPALVLDVGSSGSTIQGLVINRYGSAAIVTQFGVAPPGATIRGNFLGTNLAGTAAGPGNEAGIILTSSSNVIGGPTLADRNVISGNIFYGIQISGGGTTGNVIQGNYIGTDKTGMIGIPNDYGIADSAGGTTIGGLAAGEGNLISGNTTGLWISKGAPAFGKSSEILGNLIGTDATGTTAIGNNEGIHATSSDGSKPLIESNVISGNSWMGIWFDGSTGFSTLNNKIGTDIGGASPLANAGAGIRFENGATDTQMQGDTIAFNGGPGIDVKNAPANGIALGGGSLFSNAGLGIDLDSDGVTANDPLDADGLVNFPLLSAATVTPGATTATGTLAAAPNARYELQFYASGACDPSGNGEGKRFLGRESVTTDGAGSVAFASPLPELPIGEALTATATSEASGSTSEFSACAAAAPPASQPLVDSPPALPVQGKTVRVAPVAGRVLVRVGKRGKFHLLADGETIPVGSSVDATRGRVRLTSADAAGNLQSADFYGGRFRVTQKPGEVLTTLTLEGNLSGCRRRVPSRSRASASRSRGGRHLWGNGKGRFQTSGNNGSATVRGTIWYTADRCSGTFFKVKRGVVAVRDFTRKRSVALRAGQSYLAPAR